MRDQNQVINQANAIIEAKDNQINHEQFKLSMTEDTVTSLRSQVRALNNHIGRENEMTEKHWKQVKELNDKIKRIDSRHIYEIDKKALENKMLKNKLKILTVTVLILAIIIITMILLS